MDSFDRFGDDISELILSYLPIKDKFRLECVSKRFRLFLFSGQRHLILDYSDRETADRLNLCHVMVNFRASLSNLNKLLKKCNKVTNISVDTQHMEVSAKKSVLNAIANHCQHLYGVRFDSQMLFDDNNRIVNKFVDKYKHELRSVGIFAEEFADYGTASRLHNRLVDVSPNLRHISGLCLSSLADKRLLSTKLLSVDKLLIIDDNYNHLTSLSNDCFKNLKNLSIEVWISSVKDSTFMESLSQLEGLNTLKITSCTRKCVRDLWPKTFKSVAISCKSLTNFAFISLNKDRTFNTRELLESFAEFSSLKKFSLIADYSESMTSKSNQIDLRSLNKCKSLTSLDLRFQEVGDEIVEDISSYLPQLKYVSLNGNLTLSDFALEQLEQLENLSTLKFVSHCRLRITVDGIRSLISHCHRFNSLTCLYDTFANFKQFVAIHELARHCPQIEFKIQSLYRRF